MQQYHDARYTAVVHSISREFEPLSLQTDSFTQAVKYIKSGSDRDYGVVIDNQTGKTVLRINSQTAWARDQAFELV